ncbi:MAG: FtsQ-type POTRA domain-containing protein [Deltaproteobacteria bacterium]|jgi:cell division protein FtsQ|nr:FtsQ-type POTRA domain-containing protein [Deltaproteobacteria bacterium]
MHETKAKRSHSLLERINVPKGGKWREKDREKSSERKSSKPNPTTSKRRPREGSLVSGKGKREESFPRGLRIDLRVDDASKGAVKSVSERSSSSIWRKLLGALKATPRYLRKALSFILLSLGALTILGIVTGLLIMLYVKLNESDFFTIKSFDIRGTYRLTRAQILSASGLDKPVSLFGFDSVAAVRSLKSLPWIEDADISRTPPPDGITIRVKEYTPRAIVNLEQLHYIDESGRPFKSLEPGETPDFPIVSGFSLDELLNGGPLMKRAVSEVFELMDILKTRSDSFNLDKVSEILYDPDIGMTLFMVDGGLEVRVGFGPYSEKIRRVSKVLDKLKEGSQDEGLIYLNLESTRRVTARYLPGFSPREKGMLERGEEPLDS